MTRPTHLTTCWVNIRGILHPTLIINIRSSYNCHTFLCHQDKSIKPYIGLISGDIKVRSSKPLFIKKLKVEVKSEVKSSSNFYGHFKNINSKNKETTTLPMDINPKYPKQLVYDGNGLNSIFGFCVF